MKIDKFLFDLLDEYDGFKYKSTLNEDEARLALARYAVACMHDTTLASEAMAICNGTAKEVD